MVLNDAAIRAAKPGVIWDSTLPGFGLRVGKNSKTFIVLVASGRRKKVGRYMPGVFGVAQAREQAKKVLAEKVLGKIIPTHTAYDEAKADFLANCAERLRPSTIRLYTYHLDKHFKYARKSIADINGSDILRSLKGLKRSEKEHAFRVGRTFFTWCYHNHLIDRSPMERMETPALWKSRERFLDDEELRKVYREALKLSSNLHRLVWLLLRTGQRPGELMKLKTAYVEADRISLPGEVTKNGQPHAFPISEGMHRTIQTFPTDSAYVLPAGRSHVRGKPVETFVAASEARKDFRETCGVDGWTLHDCRRTVATHMEQLGVRPEVIEAVLNHVSGSKAGVGGVYRRHKYFPEMQAAFALWENKLAGLTCQQAEGRADQM
jgi:integrase